MKKVIALVLILLSLTSVSFAASSFDISGLTFEELVALKDQINLAIWNSEEWQEVTVPQGVWVVGEDIPAGHWTISCAGGSYTYVTIGTHLDDGGHSIDLWNTDFYYSDSVYCTDSFLFDPRSDKESIDVELKDGTYVVIETSHAIFSPYSGKPSLGFK